MSGVFRKLTEIILDLRWPLLLIFVLTTVYFGYALRGLKIDPSTETLFAKDTEEYQFYQEFRRHFGSDQLIAIAIETSDYLRLEHLRQTHVLTRVLDSDARVDRVTSLTNVLDLRHKVFGVKVEPVIAGVFEGEKPLRQFRGEVLENPFVVGNLLSRDGKVGALLVRLKVKPEDPKFLEGFVGELRTFLESFPWPGARFHIAGAPVEQNDFIAAIQRDQLFLIPMVGALLALAIFLIYRSWANVVVAMSVILTTLVWTFGTISLLGRSLNLVNSLLAPVVMIISVTNIIYLINLFSELRPHHPSERENICLTIEHLGVPCFLTSATIVAGFLSLLASEVPAVQSFGLFAALGTFYSYAVAMTLMPILLPALPFRKTPEEGERHFFTRAVIFYLEKIEFRLKWFLLGGAVLALVFSILGIRQLQVNTNLIYDLPPRSPLSVATRFIDERLAGVYSLGLSVERVGAGPLVTGDVLRKVDTLARFLERQPEITKVNSFVTVVKRVHEAREGDPAAFKIPEEEGTLEDYLEKMAESDNPDLWGLVSRDFRHLRLEARMKAVGTKQGQAMEDRIWDYVRKHWDLDEYRLRLTGSVVLLGQMSKRLVTYQIHSVGLAFVVILGLICLFFRSLKMGLLAAIPNLIPIVALYGVMGYFGVELSTPTAMISSVVLGLVVDASIQFLYRFRYEFGHRKHYLQALHHTYRNVGQAMVVTTMILVFGFASSVFASFRPTVYFGLLTGLTILFSLLCSLVLLPLVLVLLKPFGPQTVISFVRKETLTPSPPSSIIRA